MKQKFKEIHAVLKIIDNYDHLNYFQEMLSEGVGKGGSRYASLRVTRSAKASSPRRTKRNRCSFCMTCPGMASEGVFQILVPNSVKF